MLYLHIIVVNAFSLLFHIYNDESAGNEHYFFYFNFNVRSLIWHLTVVPQRQKSHRQIQCIFTSVRKFTMIHLANISRLGGKFHSR